MGGKAFHLGEDAFPLIPKETYKRLKDRLIAKLQTLFEHVQVPPENPDKKAHGDVDLIVAVPRPGADVSPESVQKVIGAELVIRTTQKDKLGTSNYAIPADTKGTYYQVDVNQCHDRDEWDRVIFVHSYGDLGMILGRFARTIGLRLGCKGLRINETTDDKIHPTSFELSSSIPQILSFLGLSLTGYLLGFPSQAAVFVWVRSSRFFDPHRLSDPAPRDESTQRKMRGMYQAFLAYCAELRTSGEYPVDDPKRREVASVRREALSFFGRKEEYDAIVLRNRLKPIFNGNKVIEWTGLKGIVVHDLMEGMRTRLGEEKIVDLDEETLRASAIQVQQELGLKKGAVDAVRDSTKAVKAVST